MKIYIITDLESVSIKDYIKKGVEKIDERTVKIGSNNICDLFI